MILTLNDRVGAVERGLLIPAIVTLKESYLQSIPLGALLLANPFLTITTYRFGLALKVVWELSVTKNCDLKSAIPSVVELVLVSAGFTSSRSSGSSISMLESGIIANSAPIKNLSL